VIPQRTVAPALQALRAYWGTAVLVVATVAVGLAATLPVTSLVAAGAAGVTPSIILPPMPNADLGVPWSGFAQSPAAVRQMAVAALVQLLLGVAVGVLAVTWVTTLSVSTARADARATEIAVRRAVGASRKQLFAAALLEGSTIAVMALVVGGSAGVAAAHLAIGAWPGTVGRAVPGLGLLAIAATLGGIVLGALFPLVFARRSSQIAVPESTPLGLVVPAAQLGLSLMVLVTASLLNLGAGRVSVPRARWSAPGQVVQISTGESRPAARAGAYASLLRRVHADPAVEVASLTSPGALTGIGTVDVVWSDFADCSFGFRTLPWKACHATYYVVSADTFRALGLPVIAGRALTDADGWLAPRVAVVSRSLAPLLRPGGVLGRKLGIGHGLAEPYTVVGVVEDQRPVGIGGGLEPRVAVYLSVLQHPATAVDLLVRGRGGPGLVDDVVARAVAETLDRSAMKTVRVSEAGLLAAEAAPLRWFGRLFTVEGWALLAIATIGTFAMMWLWVASLLGELGVRRAVGARRRCVVGYVLSRAVLVAVGGAAFGSWLGMMVWDALTGVISGLPSWDPGAVLRYGLLLGGASLAGALLPAWRAARTTPVALLRV
jgi:putative ABC transport system permease protein